jgi:hypothetical protein
MRPLKSRLSHYIARRASESVRLTTNVRPRAAIRTTAHAHDDRVVPKAVLLADLLHLVDEDRKILKEASVSR